MKDGMENDPSKCEGDYPFYMNQESWGDGKYGECAAVLDLQDGKVDWNVYKGRGDGGVDIRTSLRKLGISVKTKVDMTWKHGLEWQTAIHLFNVEEELKSDFFFSYILDKSDISAACVGWVTVKEAVDKGEITDRWNNGLFDIGFNEYQYSKKYEKSKLRRVIYPEYFHKLSEFKK